MERGRDAQAKAKEKKARLQQLALDKKNAALGAVQKAQTQKALIEEQRMALESKFAQDKDAANGERE